MINYEVGDCLEFPDKGGKVYVVPHVCNDIGGWGSGFVVAISKKYNKPERLYRMWHSQGSWNQFGRDVPFALGEIQIAKADDGVFVANMIAQHNTIKTDGKPIRYRHLANTMSSVGKFCQVYQKQINDKLVAMGKDENSVEVVIRCPMFGSGLAGGDWKFIEELIDEIWIGDYDLEVTVCALTKDDLP
jgi:hypothetical protein